LGLAPLGFREGDPCWRRKRKAAQLDFAARQG